jgi:O-methyltransferase involved in polyketide biosynthesis
VGDSGKEKQKGDLSVTALYTSGAWAWGGVEGAALLATKEAASVFSATNGALSVAQVFQSDARSLKHGLLHRHAMIDHLARAAQPRRILELAAGLSPRGVAFSKDPSIDYTELDLPPMVAHKRGLLERTDEGRSVLARQNLCLVSGDVADLDATLVGATPYDVVIAEGLFMYLDAAAQQAVFERVRRLLGPTGTFVFDLVPPAEEPKPGATGAALGWMMKRFTKGRAFETAPRTRAEIVSDVINAGFTVEVFEPAQVAADWNLPHPEVPSRQVVYRARATA